MNSTKTIKNSTISVISQMINLIMRFVDRKIFVMFLDIEYLGYQSVFGNVFSLLSVAELGIGGIISFHLYREIVTHNEEEIGKLMYLYKWIYRIVAGAVLVLGLVACIFVPYVVNDTSKDLGYLYVVYFLQLASTVAGYFLSYRRTIFIVDQKEYKVIEIDLVAHIIMEALQICTLIIFKNYLLYLTIQLSTTVVANIVVLFKSNKEYPYLKNRYKVTAEDIRKRNIVSDVKNMLIHKISGAIYGGTDNIIISTICGIRDVALFGNYQLLKSGVMDICFYRLLNPVQATIGNIVYSGRKKEDLWKQFEMFDVFSFYFASFFALGFLTFFQPAIMIWFGDADLLLPDRFVIVTSLSLYYGAVWEIVYKYRSVFGDYRQDRNCSILAAVLNISLSIPLAYKLGVTGVQIGTLVAFFPIAYGRIRLVVKNYFHKSMKRYLVKHALLSCVVIAEGVIVYLTTRSLPITIVGILVRFLIWLLVPLIINTLIYYRSEHFKDLCRYLKRLLVVVENKIKSR